MIFALYDNGPGMGFELRVETPGHSVDVTWATIPVPSVRCARGIVPRRWKLYRAPAGNGRGLLAVWAPRRSS